MRRRKTSRRKEKIYLTCVSSRLVVVASSSSSSSLSTSANPFCNVRGVPGICRGTRPIPLCTTWYWWRLVGLSVFLDYCFILFLHSVSSSCRYWRSSGSEDSRYCYHTISSFKASTSSSSLRSFSSSASMSRCHLAGTRIPCALHNQAQRTSLLPTLGAFFRALRSTTKETRLIQGKLM